MKEGFCYAVSFILVYIFELYKFVSINKIYIMNKKELLNLPPKL